jgi:type I restriction-modification system DNA methylase subunit
MTETHRNNFLFSDLHLAHLLPEHPEWQTADVELTLQTLTALWERFTPQAGDAAHTESEWVRPILRALGHDIPSIRLRLLGTSPSIRFAPATGDAPFPTFVFHAGDPRGAIAPVHIRAWDCRLDHPTPTERDSPELRRCLSPASQIRAHMRHAGMRWGVLTNGRQWQLYHQDTSGKLDVYYEVDLPALLQQVTAGELEGVSSIRSEPRPGSPVLIPTNGSVGEAVKGPALIPIERFKYFYLFFRREAFNGKPCWLDNVLATSRAYKKGISRHLKEQAPEALRLLAEGFFDFPANALIPTPETLKTVHDHSLVVLYWLLFILYAESRGQLPVKQNPAYTESYSLHALTRRIAHDIDQKRPAVTSMDELWSSLRRLWRVLNAGNSDLGVSAHHGSLFDPGRYPFLEQHHIGDTHLRQAIDLLARARDPISGRRVLVDYRDLDMRHLGSMYEDLLEYHLQVAEPQHRRLETRDRRLASGSSESVQSPISNPQSPISKTQYPISLVPNNSERKCTGSYYTPDYIVRWLVEQTVGPVLDEIRDRHTEQQSDGTYRVITSRQSLVNDILNLKVLDPAMGSGHFLVEAVNFIAQYLVSLGLGPMADLGNESELTYWRRRVVQSCIYGVDVNPLAVELAKLSLWPLTAAEGRPLSFLDHHLRCGDSLLGVRMADLNMDGTFTGRDERRHKRSAGEASQLSMLDHEGFVCSMQTATSLMDQIRTLGSETEHHVRQAGHLYYDRLRTLTRRFRTLADVWTARHFGLQIGSALWSQLVQHVLHDDLETSPYADIIQHAQDIARRQRFFHWELEFPEVFFSPSSHLSRGASGFDVIIGNPPYLFGEHVPADVKPFLRRHYNLAVGQYDTYWLFYERSFWLLKRQGRHGFIVPDAVLARDEAEVLRARLLEDHRIAAIAPVGQVFDDPGVGAVLVAWENSHPDGHALHVWQHKNGSWRQRRSLPLSALAASPGHRLCIDLDARSLALVTRLRSNCRPLRNSVAVSRGEEAGRRHLRPIDDQRAGDVPVLIGSDISPLSPPTPSHCSARHRLAKDPAIYRAGKLVMVKTGRNIVCTIDKMGYVTLQSVYNLNPLPTCRLSVGYLAAILSSSLLSWYLRATVTGYKQVFPQLNQSNVEELPIRPIEFTTPADTRAGLLEKGKRLYNICMTSGRCAGVTGFVEYQLNKKPERADVVHDLLAWLAEQAIEMNSRRQTLEKTLTPFTYLDRDIPFVEFGRVFTQTSEVAATSEVRDLNHVCHDIDGLRLVEAGDVWELELQLKKRNPRNGWRSWQYEEGSSRIAREWVPACRLALSHDQGRYYQIAFEILEQFTRARPFPSGHTRTTWQKLQATRVPDFDPDADLRPLAERRDELAEIEGRIARISELIDQIVYRLYGLTDTDIARTE